MLTRRGRVVWVGVEPLGGRDGRVALYLADHLPRLLPPKVRLKPDTTEAKMLNRDGAGRGHPSSGSVRLQADLDPADLSEREQAILDVLRERGASFFGPLHDARCGAAAPPRPSTRSGPRGRTITNDTFTPMLPGARRRGG
jgi:hypothetical protein